jgi:hypothetical protein
MLSVSETSQSSNLSQTGDPSLSLRMTRPKYVALARQNARSDRVCLDFSLVTFFVSMTKKVTIKIKDSNTLVQIYSPASVKGKEG